MPRKSQSVILPAQPDIPPSNASYAKVADRLYKAAELGNVDAIEYVKGTIRGTNTYCRMLRRYADELVAAITPAPAQANGAG